MKDGISIKGIAPEWRALEVDKSNRLIRARILESQGEIDTALALYAEAAAMEERIAEYSRSIGLQEKAWFDALSAAGCWAKAGDYTRALQQYDALLEDTALPAKTRKFILDRADKLREERRQWVVFSRQIHTPQETPAEPEPALSAA